LFFFFFFFIFSFFLCFFFCFYRCEELVAREALDRHMTDASVKHVVLLGSALATTTSSLSSLRTEVTTTTSSLSSLRTEVTKLNKRLGTAIRESKVMKHALDQSQFHLEELNDPRSSAIYLCGGKERFDSTNGSASVYKYLTKERTSLSLHDLPQPRVEAAAVVVNHRLSVIGGIHQGSVQSTMYIHDEAEWITSEPLSTARADFQCIHVDNQLFAIGGHDGKTALKSCERFDTETESWSPIQNMQHARRGHGAVLVGKFIYVFGGFCDRDAKIPESSSERYNITTDEWSMLSEPPLPLGQPVCANVDNGGSITMFCNPSDRKSAGVTCMEYDVTSDAWTVEEVPSMLHGSTIAAAWELKARLYVLDHDMQIFAIITDLDGAEWTQLELAPTEFPFGFGFALNGDIHHQ
jgi:hypothetical protein